MARLFTIALCAAGLAALSLPAAAPPQILALVAANGAVPLNCQAGECSAEFSAICLQEWRPSPVAGRRYLVHGGEGIRVVARLQQGGSIDLPAEALTITTSRGHSAIKMSLPGDFLHRRGIADVAVTVGADVSLIPEPVVGDTMPQTAQDIAVATGPLRLAAARLLAQGDTHVAASAVLNRLVNALPPRGRTTTARRDGVWSKTLGQSTPPGADLARSTLKRCQEHTAGGYASLRQCLGSYHDIFIGRLNNDYWTAVKTGS